MADTALPQTAPEEQREDLNGIDGALLLPLFGLLLNPLYFIWMLYRDLPAALARAPDHRAAAVAGIAILVLPWFGFLIFCLVRFLQKRRETPVLMIVLYGLNIGTLVLGLTASSNFTDQLAARSLIAGHLVPSLMNAALSVVWIAYFLQSERVKQTFVVAAKPRGASPPRAGIGGWLLVPLTLLVALCCAVLYGFAKSLPYLPGHMWWAINHGYPFEPIRNLTGVAIVVFSVYCLVSFLRRKRGAPKQMIAFFALAGVGVIVDCIVHPPHTLPAPIAFVAICAALIAYFMRSTRVKNTFVR